MNTSPEVDQIGPAWVTTLTTFGTVAKDATGNWGTYASIGSVLATVQPVLAENGLAAHQECGQDDNGRLVVRTRVWHTSGQWIEPEDGLHLVVPPDPQKVLSALTYGRRGEQMAFFNLAPGGEGRDDDDGQQAADAVLEMSELAVAVGSAIKLLDPAGREALGVWVQEQGRPWPVMPRHLHTDPEWTGMLAEHLEVSDE